MDEILTQILAYDALWRENNALYSEWAKAQGLSYNELLVMLSLTREADAPCTQKDICRQWLLPKQTVNSILERFTRLDWVALESDPRDRRNKRIALTETGQARLGALAEALQDKERQVWQSMGPERSRDLLETTALYNRLFREVAGL